MKLATLRPVQPMPRGILSSLLVGMSGAAASWLVIPLLTNVTVSYARLDQLAALVLGGITAAAVVGAREYRQRRNVLVGAASGALLGGVGALAGASLLAFGHAAVGPRLFLLERMAAWLLTAVGATLGACLYAPVGRPRAMVPSALIAATGGATAGVIYSFPGASDVWQGLAMLWIGATIGLAVAGPGLWNAYGVLTLLPAKGRAWNPLLMREWPIDDGFNVGLGQARVACQLGRIALYPPAGGVVANGRNARHPRFIDSSTIIVVGHQRYYVQLVRMP
jgi:hypothetical protein